MKRRWRRKVAGPTPAAPAAPLAAPSPGRVVDRQASLAERPWRIAYVVARNGVAVVGVLFFGWSAPTLILLYFADTVAGMAAAFTAVAFRLSGVDEGETLWDVVYGFLSALAIGGLLAAFVAFPIGLPLVFVLGVGPEAWRAALAGPLLPGAFAIIGLTTLVEAIRHYLAMRQGGEGEASVKRAFAILFIRWMFVVIAIYQGAILFGRFAPYVLVAVYAAASAWSDIDPQRFANLVPDPAERATRARARSPRSAPGGGDDAPG